MATPRQKATDRLARAQEKLSKIDSTHCVSTVLPELGLQLMRCRGGCARCDRERATLATPSIFESNSKPTPMPSTDDDPSK